MKDHHKPTQGELEILKVLWQMGASTVRDVNEKLNELKAGEIGYTTTLKLMQIMYDKGFLTREKDGRTHIYQALISEKHLQKNMVDGLMDNMFHGSAMKLVMQALGSRKTSKDELEEIRSFLDQLEEEN